TVLPNNSTRIQTILPGETAQPGNTGVGGKNGTPTNTTAGEPYLITVNLTDNYFNAVGNTGANVSLRLTTPDPYDPSDPDNSVTLNLGVATHTVIYNHPFQRATTTGWMVTVATRTGVNYVTSVAGPVKVDPDTNSGGLHTHQVLIVLPGETFDP